MGDAEHGALGDHKAPRIKQEKTVTEVTVNAGIQKADAESAKLPGVSGAARERLGGLRVYCAKFPVCLRVANVNAVRRKGKPRKSKQSHK